ncbi:hypothetical protein LU656_20470, partial [Pseudomonas sp. NMI1173_11]|nr:hypothetical protein [Pseudomonas sp. NMI1173_11]
MVKRSAPLSTHKPVDTPPSSIPSSVTKAMQAELGLEITGYLSSVKYGTGELFLRGIVFGDREKRFDDGELIRTSIIMADRVPGSGVTEPAEGALRAKEDGHRGS